MNRTIAFAALILVLIFSASAIGQDKKVTIGRFEVDGRVVKSKFKVTIVTAAKKVYKAKTDETGFVVPAEVITENKDSIVGVIIAFDKHVLEFFTLNTSNFDVGWKVVAVDKEPFEPDNIGDSDPSTIESAYYIEFEGESARRVSVKKSKPQTTIRRMNK